MPLRSLFAKGACDMRISAEELEAQVVRLRICAAPQTGPERLRYDRDFARLVAMLEPRVRHLIRSYGLVDLAPS